MVLDIILSSHWVWILETGLLLLSFPSPFLMASDTAILLGATVRGPSAKVCVVPNDVSERAEAGGGPSRIEIALSVN